MTAWKGIMEKGLKERVGELAKQIREPQQKLDIPQKPAESICVPAKRADDWVKNKDPVAVVRIEYGGKVRVRPGFICNYAGSQGERITVRFDDSIAMAAHSDDEHEESYDLKDPCLMRLDEVGILRVPDQSISWFAGLYHAETARQISELLCKPDFGRQDELDENAEAHRLGGDAARKKLGHYEAIVFHPPVIKVKT